MNCEKTIFRIRKGKGRKGFTSIDNMILLHAEMLLQAKGLLCLLLKFPDNFKVHVSYLTKILPEGKDAIYSTMNQLIKFGFVERVQHRLDDGTMGEVIYYIHEKSIFDHSVSSAFGAPFPANPLLTSTEKRKAINNKLFRSKKIIAGDSQPGEVTENVVVEKEVVLQKEIKKEEIVVAKQAESVDSTVDSVSTVDIYPCDDGVSKGKSLLRHCVTVARKVELSIGESLTAAQSATVVDVANYFSVKGGESELREWIEISLLSCHAFSRCTTFIHKLNAIILKIRTNSFTKPRLVPKFKAKEITTKNAMDAAQAFLSKQELIVDPRVTALNAEIRTVSIQISSSRSAMEQFKNYEHLVWEHKNNADHFEGVLADLRLQLQNLKQSEKLTGEHRA